MQISNLQVSAIQVSFRYGESETEEAREIIRNVKNILRTPAGTCPLYREFGTDVSMVDKPLNVAQNLYSVAVIEAVEKWEPRVIVHEVIFTPDPAGQLAIKVVLEYG